MYQRGVFIMALSKEVVREIIENKKHIRDASQLVAIS